MEVETLLEFKALLERQAFPTKMICQFIDDLIERLEPSRDDQVAWVKWYRAINDCGLKEAVDELKRLNSLKH